MTSIRLKGFLFSFIFILASCANDTTLTKNNPPIYNSLVGQWEWIKSVNAFAQITITPKTEGYTLSYKFKSNDTVDTFKDEQLINSYPFVLKYIINDILNTKSDSTIVLVINNGTESFLSIKKDTLVIDQSYVDGPTSFYVKRK